MIQGPKNNFKILLRAAPSCQLHQTYVFIMLDPKCQFLFIKTHFKAFLIGEAFKLCIGLYYQNLAGKKKILDSNLLLFNDGNLIFFSTIWVYMFLENIFVFCVKYQVFIVYCTLSRTEQASVTKEDFRFKWYFMWQNHFKIFWNSSLIQYNLGLYVFNLFSLIFLSFSHQNTPKTYFFLLTIYIRLS